jgi:hypothetical protein
MFQWARNAACTQSEEVHTSQMEGLKGKRHMGNIWANRIIILKYCLKYRRDSSGSGYVLETGCYENSNESNFPIT